MFAAIDKVDGELVTVVADSGKSFVIPRAVLPDACEGDVISIEIDRAETERRLKNSQNKLKSLFGGNK